MTVSNKADKPPKHLLKKGDLRVLEKDLLDIDGVSGVVVGGITGGVVGAVGGAVAGLVSGAVIGLVADDVINAIEDDLGIEDYTKAEIAEFERDAKTKSLAKKRTKKTTKPDNSWFGDWW